MFIKTKIMRKLSLLSIACISFICSDNTFAQSVAITKIIHNAERFELTVSESKDFYVGGNIYILNVVSTKDATNYKIVKQ